VIKSFKLLKQLYTLSPSHPSLDKMVDYHFKVPNMFSQIFEEASSGYQLITDGSVELVLDCCLDYWNGEDLGVIDRNVSKKIFKKKKKKKKKKKLKKKKKKKKNRIIYII